MAQGSIFQRTYKGKDGTIRTCATWTIRWHRGGRAYEEATAFTRKGEALNLLKLRNGDVAKGKPLTAAQFKLTFDDAAQTVIDDFKANEKRSLKVVERRINKHLRPYFGGRRLSDISWPLADRGHAGRRSPHAQRVSPLRRDLGERLNGRRRKARRSSQS